MDLGNQTRWLSRYRCESRWQREPILAAANTSFKMKVKKVLKWLDDARRVFAKLEKRKLAVEACVLATLIYALIRIVAHH